MQSTNKSKNNKAISILSGLIKKEAKQSLRGDAGAIAKKIGLRERTVTPYLRGVVADFNTGSVILTELRKLIKDREDFAMELQDKSAA